MPAAEKQTRHDYRGGTAQWGNERPAHWIDQRFPLMENWRSHLSELLRAEKFQFLVLLRFARAFRPGDPARHRHFPHE